MASSGEVDICNRALDAIGVLPITSFLDDSKSGELCRRYYPQVRDEMLRAHPWNFAVVRASLPALVDAPTWGFDLAYELPVDCLRVLRIEQDDDEGFSETWRIEGRTIVTNATAPLQIIYVARVTDETQFDPMFTAALAARLAMELAVPLTSDMKLRQVMEQEWMRRLRDARSANGQEGTPAVINTDAFPAARL